MSNQDELEEISVFTHTTEDGTEFTLVLKRSTRMSADDIMIELESYTQELNRAEDQKKFSVIQ